MLTVIRLLSQTITPQVQADLTKIIDGIKVQQGADLFLHPVSLIDVPDYRDIIKRPMDLSKALGNLRAGKYPLAYLFVQDICLIFENCRTYNDPQSDIFSLANNLELLFFQKLDSVLQKIKPM